MVESMTDAERQRIISIRMSHPSVGGDLDECAICFLARMIDRAEERADAAEAARPAAVTDAMVEAGVKAWSMANGFRTDHLAPQTTGRMLSNMRAALTAALAARGPA